MGNINIPLPDELHKELKILSVEQGLPLKDLVILALGQKERRHGKH